ncbi:MAG: TetR/AcrR family transcriptional regulator [Melioribacteraceae bacterium]|nr:MAG: TetR/AcrR family transcriptional regulator [Melioribacteraceae bacterium]
MARLSTEERQRHIIDEAIKIIHNNGYEALSIRELSSRVQISEPAIYRHFLNKEDIVLGILMRIREFDELLKNRIERAKSTKGKLTNFIEFHFEFLDMHLEMTSVLFSEDIFSRSNLLKKKLMEIIIHRKTILTEIVDDAKDRNEIKILETDTVVLIILGVIRLTVLEWRLSDFSFSLIEKSRKVVKTLTEILFK